MSADLPSSDQAAVAVSIVVPVRNEADNVAPLIAEITAALDGRWAYEIIYINDGSTDATAERLATLMKVLRDEILETATLSRGVTGAAAR